MAKVLPAHRGPTDPGLEHGGQCRGSGADTEVACAVRAKGVVWRTRCARLVSRASPAEKGRRVAPGARTPYLVDPASNHMLVSKIKPCMSKYKPRTRRDCGRLIKSVMNPLGPDSPVDNVR